MTDMHQITRSLDYARFMRVVLLLSFIALPFNIVLYLASSTNIFKQIQLLNFSSPPQPDVELHDMHLVHDEHYELKKVLKAASMPNNTVIVTLLNKVWAKPNSIFDIFIESFKLGNNKSWLLNHLMVIAVDEKAYKRCKAKVTHCYNWKSAKSTGLAREVKFMSSTYMDMVWAKQAFLGNILSLGYNFVFSDTDIVWFRNPFPHFEPDIDIQISSDVFNGDPLDVNNLPNSGFKFIRSNNRTIEFYKYWVLSRWNTPGATQAVFNKIKYEPFISNIGLTLRFLDTDYFGGFCTPSKDLNKVCTMHANCCVGLKNKIDDLRATLDDWKNFVQLASNQTVVNPITWSVPNKCQGTHLPYFQSPFPQV